MSDGQDLKRYSAGERIVVRIELHDDSGIYDVTGLFVHSDNPNAVITLPGYGGGAKRATVYIQNFVTTNTPPGRYVCKYIQAQDGRGNYSTLHPDISIYVDQHSAPVDDQGPEMGGWGFPSEEIQVAEMSVIEAERRLELMARGTDGGTSIDRGTPEGTSGTPEKTEEDAQENIHQVIEGKIAEGISGMTEDTGAGGDVGLHVERRMDEIAHDVTEETGAEGDVHLHVERKMNQMAKDMFEED